MAMNIPDPNPMPTYKSLKEIQMRKDMLLRDIHKDDKQMKQLWADLFHSPASAALQTPTKRFTGLMNTGAGVLDGLILGWKLYRKFKGGHLFKK